jgi:hypothetical protein
LLEPGRELLPGKFVTGVWGDGAAANGERAASQLIGSKVRPLQRCLSIEESVADLANYALATDGDGWLSHHIDIELCWSGERAEFGFLVTLVALYILARQAPGEG